LLRKSRRKITLDVLMAWSRTFFERAHYVEANRLHRLATSQKGDMMLASLKSRSALAVLACIAVGTSATSASAITAEVAKRCEALTAKAYPPRVPGNPAAGSAKGSGPAERKYFSNCVAHGGISTEPEPTTTGEALPAAAPTHSGGQKVR
jgi:hypothetical protein